MKTRLSEKFLLIVFLTLLCGIFLAQNISFLKQDHRLPSCDAPRHIMRSWVYLRHFNDPSLYEFPRDPFPPLMYFNSVLFYKYLGFSQYHAYLSIQVFAVIFIIAMFGIGYELGKGPGAVVISSLACASPHFLNFSRHYHIDFPVTAMIAVGYYFLLKTDNYKNTMFSYMAGIALALAFLTKWSAVFFLIFPFLLLLFPSIKKSKMALVITLSGFAFFAWIFLKIRHFVSLAGEMTLNELWQKNYPENFLVPSLVVIILSHLLEIFIAKKYPNSNLEAAAAAFNFIRTGCIIAILISPWILWCSKTINIKFFGDLAEAKNFFMTLNMNFKMLVTQFSLAPWLILTSLYYAFFYPDEGWKKRITAINLLLVFILMSSISLPSIRYVLPFIVFSAPLGALWLQKTRKVKNLAIVIMVLLSLTSIIGWLLIPQSMGILRLISDEVSDTRIVIEDVTMPLAPVYPDPETLDLSRIVAVLRKFVPDFEPKKRPLFITGDRATFPKTPIEAENISIEALSQGYYIEFQNIEYEKPIHESFKKRNVLILQTTGGKNLDFIMENIVREHIGESFERYSIIFPGRSRFEILIFQDNPR